MWPNPQETADFVPFTEEILNGKLHFMCSDSGTSCDNMIFALAYPKILFLRFLVLMHSIL